MEWECAPLRPVRNGETMQPMEQNPVSANRRLHERVSIDETTATLEVRYESSDEGVIRAMAKDVSPGGVMVMHEKPVKVGTRVHVEFENSGPEGRLDGRVVHCHRIGVPLYRIGIRFDDELSEDAFRTLMGGAEA